jgi:thymidylate synthase (FAD)
VKGSTNRQSSLETDDKELLQWWEDVYIRECDAAFDIYHQALARGIAAEVARFILPLSVSTRLYMAGSVRSWIHYFELRCDEHTQLEHREIALAARAIFTEQFPIISKALEYGA